jgi:hypothetical protein
MSGAPDELETLLQRVVSDPGGTLGRVLDQALAQLLGTESTPDPAAGPEALLVSAITRRLGLLEAPEPYMTFDEHLTEGPDPQAGYLEQLMDRNSSLASALGACDCWGDAPDCPICSGEGHPGWAALDRELFAAYVGPALAARNDRGVTNPAIADQPDENHQKEAEDDNPR